MFLDIATNQKVDSKGFMCLPHIFSSLFFEIPSHSLHLRFKKKINFFVLNASNFTKITIPYLKGLILDGIIIS